MKDWMTAIQIEAVSLLLSLPDPLAVGNDDDDDDDDD